MRVMDDDDIIEGLRDGIRERAAAIDVPERFGEGLARAARRQTARRTVLTGAPVLAVAAAAAAVIVSTGAAGPGRVAVGGARAHNTSYLARRVSARMRAADARGVVIKQVGTQSMSGPCPCGEALVYMDPSSGTTYQHTVDASPYHGRKWTEEAITPVGRHQTRFVETYVDVSNHTWGTVTAIGPGRVPSLPDLTSSTRRIELALRTGRVTRAGTATVDGQAAIVLDVHDVLGGGQPTTLTDTLYVNADTYAPIQDVWVDHRGSSVNPPSLPTGRPMSTTIETWMPATPANVTAAQATDVPVGYTRRPDRHVSLVTGS